MKKIVFIAPFTEILTTGEAFIKDLGLVDRVDCFIGQLGDGVEIARKAAKSDVDVIVSRGGTAELIAKSDVQIPVVEIPITFQDLSEALLAAKKMIGHQNPKIAVAAFANMIHSIEVFAKVMDVELVIYQLTEEEEITDAIARVAKDKPDVLIGGMRTIKRAQEQGLKTVLLVSGDESFRTAFLQAENVSYARQLEKGRMQKFRSLVDCSVQGIISIDQEKRIEVFNHAAERIFGCRAADVLDKNIESVCSALPIASCLTEGKVVHSELIQVDNRSIMANMIPISIDSLVIGAMITIEEIGQIIEKEAKIRKEIYSKGLTAQYQLSSILGKSPQITEIKRVAEEYAAIDATVLIMGTSGTGKELFAQSIHNASKRRQKPFVAINCGSLTASLLESELFGYVEGAFTGANKKGKVGFFELAHGGTIFLDEIGEMNKLAQISLLRVIQERRVMRIGDDKYVPIDVRIITATNKNLLQLVEEGNFREDLYYRINVLPLELPALKDRSGDAVYLAKHFVALYNEKFGREVMLDDKAKAYIRDYSWPGNVRQLKNLMERLVLISKQKYISSEIMESTFGLAVKPTSLPVPLIIDQADATGDTSEKARILRILSENHYNQKATAKQLGIDRSTLYRKLKSLHIEVKKICNT